MLRLGLSRTSNSIVEGGSAEAFFSVRNQSDTSAPPAELVRVLSDLSIKSTAISLASSPVSLINVNEKGAGPNNFHSLTALSAGARRNGTTSTRAARNTTNESSSNTVPEKTTTGIRMQLTSERRDGMIALHNSFDPR